MANTSSILCFLFKSFIPPASVTMAAADSPLRMPTWDSVAGRGSMTGIGSVISCSSSGTGEISARVETGAGVCDWRSTLWRADDGADEVAPGRLATGGFGSHTFDPFLILKLMIAICLCAWFVGIQ
jgi:hypothetical protein